MIPVPPPRRRKRMEKESSMDNSNNVENTANEESEFSTRSLKYSLSDVDEEPRDSDDEFVQVR